MFKRLKSWLSTPTLENRNATLDSSSGWIRPALGMTAAPAVTTGSALGIAAFNQGVKLISESVAKTDLFPARREQRGGWTPAITHPAYDLLRHAPNSYQTAYTFWATLLVHALVAGQGLAEIKWAGNRPTGLHLLDPAFKPVVEGNRMVYRLNSQSIDAADIIAIRGLSWNGTDAFHPVNLAREMLWTRIAETTYQAATFANGAQASGHLEIPGNTNPEQRSQIRQSWNETHQGPNNAANLGLLWGGTKFVQTSYSPADAKLIESQNFGVAEVSRLLNIPGWMLGVPEAIKPSTTEEGMSLFVALTLSPWFRQIQQELDLKLFTREERRNLFFYHDTKNLTQGDSRSQVDEAERLSKSGLISLNEARLSLGRNPIDDERFDHHYIGTNNQQAVETIQPGVPTQPAVNRGASPPKDDGQARRAMQSMLADPLRRMAKIEANELRRLAKKDRFDLAAAEHSVRHASKLAEALEPAIAASNAILGTSLDARSIASAHAEEILGELRSLWTIHTPDDLPAKLEEFLLIREANPKLISLEKAKLTLSLDFNGVIHDHVKGPGGKGPIPPDSPEIPGAIDFLTKAVERFKVSIGSARFSNPGDEGQKAKDEARAWLVNHGISNDDITDDPDQSGKIFLTGSKVRYLVALDDRSIRFDGTFPDLDELEQYQPWNTPHPLLEN